MKSNLNIDNTMYNSILKIQASRNKYNEDMPELYMGKIIKILWKGINKC